jgi:hypothetical protein
MKASLGAIALLLAMVCAPDARAGVVIYRCTDAFGRLTVQNDVPCPKGSHQRKQVIDTPPPMPAYRAPAEAPHAPQPVVPMSPAPAVAPDAATTLLPPPPLFRCHTPEHDSYLSEDGVPSPRCIAQDVVGLDGSPGAGATACEVQRDTCERIPDGEACAAWQQRAREAEATLRFGRVEASDKNRAEFERIQRVLRESTCAEATPAK